MRRVTQVQEMEEMQKEIKLLKVFPESITRYTLTPLQECSNPHVVQFFGSCFERDENGLKIYLLMEFCEAGSLR